MMFENEKVSADDLQKFNRAAMEILEVVKQYKATKGVYSILVEVLGETGNKLDSSLGE